MAGLVSKVELGVSCRNLPNRDTLSKSDPVCVLYMNEFAKDSFTEVGRSEVIKDTLNPDFVEKFTIDFFFEQAQNLRIKIYDSDSDDSSWSWDDDDFLGKLEISLGEVVSRGNLEKPLKGKHSSSNKGSGTVIVRAEQMGSCSEAAVYQLSATKLDNKDTFGKSDPFLVISRANADGSFTPVDKTEVVDNDLSPTWTERRIHMLALCNGDYSRQLQVECFDHDSGGGHDLIGLFTTTAEELKSGRNNFELINPKKQAKKKSYKNSGTVNVLVFRTEMEYTFLDYIQAGTQINFTVAVDFTGSNGDPRDPSSLHYVRPDGLNDYVMALTGVGSVVESYDSDRQFPALGFGGKLPDGMVSHEFFLNQTASPFCYGINGVVQAYHHSIRTVQLWGPTNFAPVIRHVMNFARTMSAGDRPDTVPGHHYFILLILTDGAITDIAETVEAIVTASFLPMSIIIVGVGDADFSAMEILDCDKGRLTAGEMVAQRDIVQFVDMPEYENPLERQAYLAKQVLAEVPGQFLSYMRANNITPAPFAAQRPS